MSDPPAVDQSHPSGDKQERPFIQRGHRERAFFAAALDANRNAGDDHSDSRLYVPAVDFNLGTRGQLEGARLEMIRRESLEDILGL